MIIQSDTPRYLKLIVHGTPATSRQVSLVRTYYLRLILVHPEAPLRGEALNLLYGLFKFRLAVGKDEHVVRECEEVASLPHGALLGRRVERLLQIDVE